MSEKKDGFCSMQDSQCGLVLFSWSQVSIIIIIILYK